MLLVEADVLDLRQETRDASSRVAHGGDMDQDIDKTAVRPHIALLDRITVAPACKNLLEEREIGLEIVRMRKRREGRSPQVRAGNTDKLRKSIVAAHDTPLHVHHGNADRRMLEGKIEERQTRLSALLERMIVRVHESNSDIPREIADRFAGHGLKFE